MNIQKLIQASWPYLLIIFLFIVISFAYFNPLLDGKELQQMDLTHTYGMSKEITDFRAKTGEDTQWTNSMFSGMPIYQIVGPAKVYNIFKRLYSYVRLKLPYTTVGIFFIYLLGFFVLLISLKVDKWLAFLGALGFALVSYNLIIIEQGHITKAYAIGFMAPVLGGVILTYRGKYLLGGIITLLSLGFEVASTHVQITYYLAMMIGLLIVFELVEALKQKTIRNFIFATLISGFAGLLAVAPDTQGLWVTYEYGKETTRGKQILKDENIKNEDGLDKDYAFSWSYGIKETLTLMIPNAVGGGRGYIGDSKRALEKVSPEYREAVAQQSSYWGDQPFTAGPVYLGAVICFLFLLGTFFVKGKLKWWLVAVTILSVFLAWGKYFQPFNDFFFYYVPLYNKFRTVTMALVIASLSIPLLGMLGLMEIVNNPRIIQEKKKEFFIALGFTGGLCLILSIIPGIMNFISAQEWASINQQLEKAADPAMKERFNIFLSNIEKARISIFRTDALRSLGFIIVAAALLWLLSINKLKKAYIVIGLILLVIIDQWTIDRRYLNNDNFVNAKAAKNQFQPTQADQFILKDVDPYYRVFNISRNPFTEVNTSYFHKSIGGYHGAKLRRYQDLIDKQISKEMNFLSQILSKTSSRDTIGYVLSQLNVLNMLNAKYVIFNPNQMPLINLFALGNAWVVRDFRIANTPNEEMAQLDSINPKTTAIISKDYIDQVNKVISGQPDSARLGLIKLTEYKPNLLRYQVNNQVPELTIFSDIYYEKGWNAYIDGKKAEYFRANYALRAMVLPKGPHMLEFKFEPSTFDAGGKISIASSILVVLVIFGALAKLVIDERKKIKLLHEIPSKVSSDQVHKDSTHSESGHESHKKGKYNKGKKH